MPLPTWTLSLWLATAPAAAGETFLLPGPLPAFVGAVDADPAGERVGVIVGHSDAGVRVAVLDTDGRLVFLRDGLMAPAGAIAVGASRVAVAAPDDAHAPGAALRVWPLSPSRDRDAVIAARTTAPRHRLALGDVAAVAIDLSPDEATVAVAVTGLVDQRGALVLVVGDSARRFPLPFTPTAVVFRDAGHVVVGGAGGVLAVDVQTGAFTPTPGPQATALAIVGTRLLVGHGPVAVAGSAALGCVDGAPVWLAGPDTPVPAGHDDDALPCPRFSGGPILVGARHGIDDRPTITIWR